MYFSLFLVFLKKHFILVTIWSVLLIMISYSMIVNWIHRNFEISCNELIFLINKKGAVIVDIRSQNDYDHGHIISSINLSIDAIKDGNIFSLKNFKDKPVIIVGKNIKASNFTRQYLKKMDFTKVYVLKGGIDSWQQHDFPLLSK